MPHKSEPFPRQDIFRQIILDAAQQKLSGNSFKGSILNIFQEILDFSQSIIQQIETTGQSPLVSCECGCSYCCHSRISIIPIEALLIHSFVSSHFTALEISLLQKRIAHSRHLTHGKTLAQCFSIKKQLPCVFLKSRECSIYTVRPSICRSWNSLDKGKCLQAYESENHLSKIDSSPARNFVFGTARDIFQILSREQSLQSEVLNMNTALFNCFQFPDPLSVWSLGEPLFSGSNADT